MSEQIKAILKRKLDGLAVYGGLDAETRRNVLKEELQFYVLNFIYHNPEYSSWIMYGGSALRIIHGLDRMSVDLDFEVSHAVTENFLKKLKKEIEDYFLDTYGAGTDFLTVKIATGRGLLLKFNIGEELSFGNLSKQVHVKIDLNNFVAPKTVIERRPINHDQLSFVIVTYNMAALMASKIAAIFLRESRGVGKAMYEEKGRDIYDLLWYMNRKVVPDFEYLKAKDVKEAKDLRSLFDKLTIKMNSVSKENLKQDLSPMFVDQVFIENWLKNWHESYLRLLDEYKIHTVTVLRKVVITVDFSTDSFSFTYEYDTTEMETVRIRYIVTYEWIKFQPLLGINVDEKVIKLIEFKLHGELNEQQKQCATLFSQKNENYFKKNNRVILGSNIVTKVICLTADNLNPREQIVLNKSALISCKLDDLLK
jgi:hypothetical protein